MKIARYGLVLIFVVVIGVQIIPILLSPEPFGDFSPWLGVVIPLVVAAFIIPFTWRLLSGPQHLRKEFKDAPTGLGTLVEARPTGTQLNDQPEMELIIDVETAEGRTFRGATKEVISLGSLPQVVPGATIPVLYLPDGRIALAGSGGREKLTDLMYQAKIRSGEMTAQQVHIAKNGRKAQAVVMKCEPTGEIRGGNGVMHLEFKVTRSDGTTFDATREAPIPAVGLPGLQPGAVVEVSYSPADESYVTFDVRVR